jgi:hypothetical protein
MRVLFLDIDGVLNIHEPLDPEVMCGRIHADKVLRLNRILRESGAMIVLSSAWRYFIHRNDMNLVGLDWLLRSHGIISERLVGVTDLDTMIYFGDKMLPVENERGIQISKWLMGKKIESYCVVDDLDLGISEAEHPFVHVDGTKGLTDEQSDQIIALLRQSSE